MSVCSYVCRDCGIVFSLTKKHSKRIKPKCKKCGSKDIVKVKDPACRRSICPNFS